MTARKMTAADSDVEAVAHGICQLINPDDDGCQRCPLRDPGPRGGVRGCIFDAEEVARAAIAAWNRRPASAAIERAALERAAKAIENMRPCPFDKGHTGPLPKPSEPCPVCGDLGTDWSEQSNCSSPAAVVRALISKEETK